MTLKYANTRSVKALIELNVNEDFWRRTEPDEDRRVQRVVHLVLNTTRQWFEYRLPKLLGAVSLPMSAIRKIERYFLADEPWNTVFSRLRDLDLSQMSLLPYEERKLRAAVSDPRRKQDMQPLGVTTHL